MQTAKEQFEHSLVYYSVVLSDIEKDIKINSLLNKTTITQKCT